MKLTSRGFELAYAAILLADAKMIDVSGPKYAGPCSVRYTIETGHQIEVFDDAGEWDYIDTVVFPSGRRVNYEDLPADIAGFTRSENSGFVWKSAFHHELEDEPK